MVGSSEHLAPTPCLVGGGRRSGASRCADSRVAYHPYDWPRFRRILGGYTIRGIGPPHPNQDLLDGHMPPDRGVPRG